MKGKITVKRTIGSYCDELRIRPDDKEGLTRLLQHGMEAVELLWAGPMVRRMAKDNHLFSQDRGTPWPENAGPENRAMLSDVYICLRDLADSKFYKARFVIFLHLLPRFFSVYRDGCDIGYGMDGFFTNTKGGDKMTTPMTEEEVADFTREFGKPIDVRTIDFNYWSDLGHKRDMS
jgi:hypothetical protein